MSLRTDRIANQLRDEIARVLRDDVADARVRMVTLTRVDVAPDLSNAIVQWSLFDKNGEPDLDRLSEIEDGLDSAAGFVRRRVARVLELRKMPALRFRYDDGRIVEAAVIRHTRLNMLGRRSVARSKLTPLRDEPFRLSAPFLVDEGLDSPGETVQHE